MNKRIQDLGMQAGLYVDLNGAPWPRAMSAEESEAAYKKFAELIVFECVHAVMDGSKEGDWYAQKIEEHFDNGQGGILHFGVEE